MIPAVLHYSGVEGNCFVHRWSLTQSFDLPRCCLESVSFAYVGSTGRASVSVLGAIRYHMLQLGQLGLRLPCLLSRSYLQCHWLG